MTHWYIIRCTSGQEGRAECYLERLGYPHGWHPVRKVRLSEAVYQRLIRAWKKLGAKATTRKPDRYRIRPYVYGYVFLPAVEVEPFRINGHHPGFWMEVLSVDGKPYTIRDEQMAQMRDVPERIAELARAAEEAARAAWEAKRPKVGGKAKITSGSFEGMSGNVNSIRQGEAEVEVGGMFQRVKVPETMLEAVQA